MEIKLNNESKIIFDVLNSNGFECFIVGGCVRDFLMNKIPNDIDFTTNAKPEQIKECFKNFHYFEKGIQHGTISVVINNNEFEITTYRTDGNYINNRKPEKVFFVSDIKQDLSRRDFTINAMAYNPKTGFIDYHNGISDLNSKIIKCVNNPFIRFKEDALRILRALRFSASLCFEIEPKTKQACFDSAYLLKNISKERVRDEFFKTIIQPDGLKTLFEYKDIWGIVIPEILNLKSQNKIPFYFNSNLSALKNIYAIKDDNCLSVYLSLLFNNITDIELNKSKEILKNNINNTISITKSILKKLHTDKKTIKEVLSLINYKNTDININKPYIKKLCYKLKDIVLLKKFLIFKHLSDSSGSDKTYSENNCLKLNNIISDIEKENLYFNIKDLDINGNDLKELGIQEKEIGHTLQLLLALVLNEEIENKKFILKNYIKKLELN